MQQSINTLPKLFCFVLMPFDGKFADVYQIGIKESCALAGAYCERVDEQIFHERILDRIYNQISKADIVIADMTDRNPNVFYEVGYAHALGKTVILLTQHAEDIPFDLKHFPHIVYGNRLVDLREALTKRLKWFVSNPPAVGAVIKDEFEVYVQSTLHAGDTVATYEFSEGYYPNINLTIHNISAQILRPEKLRAAFIVDATVGNPQGDGIEVVQLPNGRKMLSMPELPHLFPDQFASVHVVFDLFEDFEKGFDAIFRLFTELGPRDYPIAVKCNPRN